MKISELFSKPITRSINGVVKADQVNDEIVWQELDEYVVTKELDRHYRSFFEAYLRAKDNPNDPVITAKMGVWVSGFFGSGKSHFIKMLSYLLENKEAYSSSLAINKRAAEFFSEKIDDAMLSADVGRAVRDTTDVILFNIDSKADRKDSADAILSVFLRVFNEMQGFSGDAPYIAQMERFLAQEGTLDKFREEFAKATDSTWEQERDAVGLLRDEVITALTIARKMTPESAAKWFDSADQAFTINIEGFAKLVRDYLDKKGKNHRIIFLVDEVGQFIGNNTQLMLTLQTLTENLGTICQGRAWVIVTSQADIDAAIGENNQAHSQDFSKIQGRFATRLSLSSANTDEVIAERLLKKTVSAQHELSTLFASKGDILKNQLSFIGNDVNMRNYRHEHDFIKYYPFAPYHFQLIQKIFEEIRKVGATGQHLSRGERSLLDAFQSAGVANLERGLGALIPLYDFYPSIESFLDPIVKKTIDVSSANEVLEAFDTQLLKVLFLIRYIDIVKPNVDNLVTLCIDEVDADRLALKRKIEASLARLEKENLISRNGDHYFFLTNEEQDVSRQIKAVDVAFGEQTNLLKEWLFEEVFNQKSRVRYKPNKADYDFNRLLDAVPYRSSTHELSVEIVSSLNDEYGFYSVSKCIGRSGEVGALIRLADDKDLLGDLRLHCQVEKFVRLNNDTNAAPSLRRILTERSTENKQRKERVVHKLEALVQSAQFFALGQSLNVKASSPEAMLDELVTYLIENTYPKLSYLRILQDDAVREIRMTLLSDDLGQHALNLDGEEGNAKAVKELRDHLQLAASQDRVLLSDITQRFAKKPYGWPEMETALLVTRLYMAREIKLMIDGGDVEPRDAIEALTKPQKHRSVSVLKRKTTDQQALNRLRQLFKDMYSTLPREAEADIEADFRAKLDAQKQELTSYKELASTGRYPGQAELTEALKNITQQLAIRDSFEFLTALNTRQNDWLNFADDLHDIVGFFKTQRQTWERMYSAMEGFKPNRADLLKDEKATAALNELESIRNAPAPYGLINRIDGLLSVVQACNNALVAKQREQTLSRIADEIHSIQEALSRVGASADLSNQALMRLQSLKKAVESNESLPELQYKERSLAELTDQAFAVIEASQPKKAAAMPLATNDDASVPTSQKPAQPAAPAAPVIKPPRTINVAALNDKAFLESEAEVEAFIDKLKGQLLDVVRTGTKVRLQ